MPAGAQQCDELVYCYMLAGHFLCLPACNVEY